MGNYKAQRNTYIIKNIYIICTKTYSLDKMNFYGILIW
jgi:hypothetical protein